MVNSFFRNVKENMQTGKLRKRRISRLWRQRYDMLNNKKSSNFFKPTSLIGTARSKGVLGGLKTSLLVAVLTEFFLMISELHRLYIQGKLLNL